MAHIIKKYLMTRRMSLDEIVQVISAELGIKTQSLIKNFVLHYNNDIVLYDDVEKTLSTLKEKGYIIIALANHYYLSGVNEIRLPQYFTHYFYSYCIGSAKPSKRVFSFVEKEMNIPGKEILHVGDSFLSDIIGAHGAGWHTAFIVRDEKKNLHPQNVLEKADYVISRLDELLNILE